MKQSARFSLFLVSFLYVSSPFSQSIFDPGAIRNQGTTSPSQSSGGTSTSATQGAPSIYGPGGATGSTGAGTTPGGRQVSGAPSSVQGEPGRAESTQTSTDIVVKEPRTEFQEFLLRSIGRELPVFGQELFRNVPTTFAPVDNIPVTSEYIVGPGDEIMIRAWGQIDVDFTATVDRTGAINIPKVGVVNVAGIKSQDLTNYLKTVFGRVFRNFELTATLGRLRSIQVLVVGQARRPGSYTISSLSTLVNALFVVGGPSNKGSMRKIQLKRNNRLVTELDLYDLLIGGDKSKDSQLLTGDVIYIPPVGAQVAISGSVNVPAIYELKQNTPLSELVAWAGGLSTTALGQRAVVERIENRVIRRVEDFSLDPKGMSLAVKDGDHITVFSLPPRFDNAVTLRGNVAQPGRFPWYSGMRIRDLIPTKEALISREYAVQRNQIVGLDQDVVRILRQQKEAADNQLDVIDLSERRIKEGEDLTVGATIRRRQIENEAFRLAQPPQTPVQPKDPTTDPMRLVNQIRPPMKEVNWEYALIERLNPKDLTTNLVPFNLGRAVLEGDPTHNLMLLPGDIVTIFSKDDLQVSTDKRTKFVRLEGEFVSPGVYQIQPGETLRQLVSRVGIAQGAYLFGAEFTRESTRKAQALNYQEALNRIEREMEADAATRARTATTEDAANLPVLRDARRAQLARLRELKPSGRIVLEMPHDPKLIDFPDVALEDGDRLFVPALPSMVNVFGSVFTETSFLYRPEKKVADYIAQAGGPTVRADTSQTFVLRADGSVTGSTRSWLGSSLSRTAVERGDTIIVPEDFERVPLMRSIRDWTQIFYQFGLGAAALKVLKQ